MTTSRKSALKRQTSTALLMAAMTFCCLALTLQASLAAAGTDATETDEFTVTRHQDYYKAKNERFTLYVSTRIVDMKPDEKPTGYIPLIFGLWNRKSKAVDVDRDRIRLLDHYGNEVPMAGLGDLRKSYPHLRRDHGHLDFSTFGGRFVRGSRVVPTAFFPSPGTPLATTAQVHRHRRIIDLLYFKGGMEPGETYTLVITLRKSGEELAIPFMSRGETGDSPEIRGTVDGSISIGW